MTTIIQARDAANTRAHVIRKKLPKADVRVKQGDGLFIVTVDGVEQPTSFPYTLETADA